LIPPVHPMASHLDRLESLYRRLLEPEWVLVA
jgi:hypothetical protein